MVLSLLLKLYFQNIVNGALVTFQANTGVIQLFNFLYPLSSTLLKFTSDKKYDKEEVSKSTRYYH